MKGLLNKVPKMLFTLFFWALFSSTFSEWGRVGTYSLTLNIFKASSSKYTKYPNALNIAKTLLKKKLATIVVFFKYWHVRNYINNDFPL